MVKGHNDHDFGGPRAECPYCFRATVDDLQAQVRTLTEERDEAKEALGRYDQLVEHHNRWRDEAGLAYRERDEANRQLAAVRAYAEKLGGGRVSGTWQGLVRKDLLALLANIPAGERVEKE